jgi:hypothetical protein
MRTFLCHNILNSQKNEGDYFMNKKDAKKVIDHDSNLASLSEVLVTNNKGVRAIAKEKATKEEKNTINNLSDSIMRAMIDGLHEEDMVKKVESSRRMTNAIISRAEVFASVAVREDPQAEESLTKAFAEAVKHPKFKSDNYANTLQTMGAKTLERIVRKASQ